MYQVTAAAQPAAKTAPTDLPAAAAPVQQPLQPKSQASTPPNTATPKGAPTSGWDTNETDADQASQVAKLDEQSRVPQGQSAHVGKSWDGDNQAEPSAAADEMTDAANPGEAIKKASITAAPGLRAPSSLAVGAAVPSTKETVLLQAGMLCS